MFFPEVTDLNQTKTSLALPATKQNPQIMYPIAVEKLKRFLQSYSSSIMHSLTLKLFREETVCNLNMAARLSGVRDSSGVCSELWH